MKKNPPVVLFSLDEEMKRCEFDHLVFLMQYTLGDVSGAAALAEREETSFYRLLKKRGIDAKAYQPVSSRKVERPMVEPRVETERKNGGRRVAVLGLVKKRPGLSVIEIHSAIGGSYGALSVLVSHMKQTGALVATGQRGKGRYWIPGTQPEAEEVTA